MLAVRQHDARQRDAVLILHGVANHRERLDGGLAVGRDVVRAVEVPLVDLVTRDKAVDLDGMVALDLNGFQLFRFDLDIFALAHFVAAPLLVALDDVAGLGVDHLLLQAVAGLLVDHMEARLLDAGGGRIQHDRAGHEGKLEGAFPIGAGGHRILQLVGDSGESGGRGTELQPRLAVLVPGPTVTSNVSAKAMPVANRKLSVYRTKRDFEKTAEPSGERPVAPST